MAVETILATWMILAASAAADAAQPAPADTAELRIYMPRRQEVSGSTLVLGAVCIMRGQDAQRVRQAEQVRLGRAPFSREEMKIDRSLILGRLAANGFSRSDIRFSGAQAVVVTPNEQEIDASRLVAAASALLAREKPCADDVRWRLASQVEGTSIPSGGKVKISAALVECTANGRATVRVNVTRDGQAEASCELAFEKSYTWRQAVARKAIAVGDTITESNVAIETISRPRPQEGWASPYGMLAAGNASAGAALAEGLLVSPKPHLAFERNAIVRIRVDLDGFSLLAKGIALQAGRVGQTIRVQNIDSKRVLTARVRADGTVVPLLEESKK